MKVFLYCLKIWFISIVVGNLLFYFVGDPTDDSSLTFWGFMAVAYLGATICSTANFLLFWFGVWFWAWLPAPLLRKRVLTSLWATSLVMAPFPIIFGRDHPNWPLMAELCGCYWIPLMAGIWIFPFPTAAARKWEGR